MQLPKLTNGMLGLALLAVFSAAVVADQARGSGAEAPATAAAYPGPARVPGAYITVSGIDVAPVVSRLRQIEAARPYVDALLAAPIRINLNLQAKELSVHRRRGLEGHE